MVNVVLSGNIPSSSWLDSITYTGADAQKFMNGNPSARSNADKGITSSPSRSFSDVSTSSGRGIGSFSSSSRGLDRSGSRFSFGGSGSSSDTFSRSSGVDNLNLSITSDFSGPSWLDSITYTGSDANKFLRGDSSARSNADKMTSPGPKPDGPPGKIAGSGPKKN